MCEEAQSLGNFARGASVGETGSGMKASVIVEPSEGDIDIAGLLRGRPGRFLVAAGIGGRIAGGSGMYLVPLRVVPPSC